MEIESCNSEPCSNSAEWSGWADWSQCTKTCGGGKTARNRKCLSSDERQCIGFTKEEKSCNDDKCESVSPSDVTVRRPEWSEWTDWSECSCFINKNHSAKLCVDIMPDQQDSTDVNQKLKREIAAFPGPNCQRFRLENAGLGRPGGTRDRQS